MRMNPRWTVGLLAAVAVATLAPLGGARAQDGAPARGLKVAIVNLADCMEPAKNDQAKDLENQLNGLGREVKEELVRIRKKADDLKVQAKTLEETSPGSPLHLKVATDWQMEEARYEISRKTTQSQLVSARDTYRNVIYAEIRRATAAVAQEMKVDLVLRGDDGAIDDDKTEGGALTSQRNMLRSVLYFDPALDLTTKVIARINDDYRKKRPAEYECPKCKVKSKEPKCPKCGEALKN